MSTLQHDIAEKFLKALTDANQLDSLTIQQLRELLSTSKRPKAEDFVKIFARPAGGDVK